MALDEYRPWKTWKCIAIAIALCHLENTPRHINKNGELKQWGRERRRERYKTIDLITEYNHFMWECNHLVHWSWEQKKCWHMLGKKFDWFQTGRNTCQHSPTWCTNGRNMLCPTCWCNMLHNMLHSFARALIQLCGLDQYAFYAVI